MDKVASRSFSIRIEDVEVEAAISIEIPKPYRSEGDWSCTYVLEIDGRAYEHRCIGIDSLQALQLAISTSDAELRAKLREMKGELLLFGEPAASLLEGGNFGK